MGARIWSGVWTMAPSSVMDELPWVDAPVYLASTFALPLPVWKPESFENCEMPSCLKAKSLKVANAPPEFHDCCHRRAAIELRLNVTRLSLPPDASVYELRSM